MAGLSDWQSNSSDGTLPNTEDAGLFQYRHYINWETNAGWNQGLLKTGKGSWHIQILDTSDNVIFEQTVTIQLSLIFFGFELVWYFYDTVGETIVTTEVDGKSMTDGNPSWSYTIGGTAQSEKGNMVPGGGDVPAYNNQGVINAFWDSPVYKMDVPVGAKLHVISDNWGLGIQVRPEWQWRFGPAVGTQIDSTFDDFGFLYSVNNLGKDGSKLQCLMSSPKHEIRPQQSITGGSLPSMTVERTGRAILLKKENSHWVLYESLDAMLSWQKSEDQVLGDDVTLAHLVPLQQGGFLMLSKSGSNFGYVRQGNDGSKTTGNISVADDTTEISASQNKAGLIYVINQEGAKIAASSDDGVTFIPA